MIIKPPHALDVLSTPLENSVILYKDMIGAVPVDQVHRLMEYVQCVDIYQEPVEIALVGVLHGDAVEMRH